MTRRFFLCLWLLLFCLPGHGLSLPARGEAEKVLPDESLNLSFGKFLRQAYVHLPANFTGGKGSLKYPLVLVFHGGGQEAKDIAKISNFDCQADKGNFIVVYPQGINKRWNDGRKIAGFNQAEPGDDVLFVRQLVEALCLKYPIDAKKIYAAGFSNGGIFCQRLGLEASNLFAGIASVSASMSEEGFKSAGSGKKLSVLIIFGKDDPIEPWGGGPIKYQGRILGAVAPVQEVVSFWVKKNGCLPRPKRHVLTPSEGALNGDRVLCQLYPSAKKGGSEVLFCALDGAGHTWPGSREPSSQKTFGKTSQSVDATCLLWSFFSSHRKY